MTNTIATAFADFVPVLAESFAAYHRRRVARMIEQGMTSREAYAFSKESYSFAKTDGNTLSSKVVGVSEEWLAKCAAEYAQHTVSAFVAKLTKKLQTLSGVDVRRADGATFVITGTLGDKAVRVEQRQTMNVSPKGTLFHQWPARIYVNGKFTPEAAFKKIAA